MFKVVFLTWITTNVDVDAIKLLIFSNFMAFWILLL